jgi:hypothetical protein
MTHPNIIIDQLLDELGRWRKQAHNWETTAHTLADAITKNDKIPEAITIYNRQVRNKYRKPRLK